MSPAAAREQVRVARRVAELPHLQAAFARGELCYSQVRAVTRVATPDTEAELLEIALHATAPQLETIVRAYRGVLEVELGDVSKRYRRRFVHCEHDEDGALVIHARLPAEEGALVAGRSPCEVVGIITRLDRSRREPAPNLQPGARLAG